MTVCGAELYFDKSRGVWVASWRKADGKVVRPTSKTRALAVASRDSHLDKAADEQPFAALDDGFEADSTIADVTAWWLQNVTRHRVRATTFATYRKQARLIEDGLGTVPALQLRHAQVAVASRTPSRHRLQAERVLGCGLPSGLWRCRSYLVYSAAVVWPR